jgi:hypothetical protein
LRAQQQEEFAMAVSEQALAERIARVLAAEALSSNANGSDPSAAEQVDLSWREYLGEAIAVLHTMREADRRMAEAGDAETWTRMVETAIEEAGAEV